MTTYTADQLERARALRETLVSLIGDPSNIANADTTIATTLAAERERAIEEAIDRMGWPEINAFHDELRKGQSVYEDAGGFMLRAIRRLFGLPPKDEVVTYQEAMRRALSQPGGST